jgi:hypothetical protein
LVQTFAKTRNYAVLAIVLTIAILAVGANSNLVSADPCIAQLNYPIMPTVYSYSNIPVVVPMAATCTTYYGSQLYATGNAYDATSNVGLGSVSTVLQSVNGGTTFNGQLGFNLPPSTQGHIVQLSVSIYNGQYGNQVTATSETIQVGTGNQLQYQQVTTTTVTQAAPYQNEYLPQNQYPISYPASIKPRSSQPQLHPYQSSLLAQSQTRNQNSSSLFGFIAIAAILAAVIIATAGLAVVYGRRQQPAPVTWIPPPQ